MRIPAPLERLRTAVEERGRRGYVLRVSEDGRPHVVRGPVRWEGDVLVADVGRRSVASATARPFVSLLSPVHTDGDYSLIVDRLATLASDDDGVRLLVQSTGDIFSVVNRIHAWRADAGGQ